MTKRAKKLMYKNEGGASPFLGAREQGLRVQMSDTGVC